MRPEFETYIRDRFARSTVTNDPFPHLVIRDVLPPELYRQMDEETPGSLTCKALSWRIHVRRSRPVLGVRLPRPYRTQEQAMFAIRPGNETTAFLNSYAERWQSEYQPYLDLVDTLTIDAYRSATTVFVEQLTRAGFLSSTPRAPEIGQGIFTHRTETWRIPPHVHDTSQLIQSMIYFPLPGSVPEQGTQLYRLRSSKVVSGSNLRKTFLFDEDDVEEAGLMPYHPNTLASFLNTPLAIHASPDIPGPARRYTFTAAVLRGVAPPERPIDLLAEFSA